MDVRSADNEVLLDTIKEQISLLLREVPRLRGWAATLSTAEQLLQVETGGRKRNSEVRNASRKRARALMEDEEEGTASSSSSTLSQQMIQQVRDARRTINVLLEEIEQKAISRTKDFIV